MPDTERRILAVLTVRDEGAFLIDWLAHHRHIGITDVIVCSNDCSDGTGAMLDRLQALGLLTHLPNPGPHPKGAQWAALALADRHPLRSQADWVVGLDIDEYINVHVGDGTIGALIDACPDATAITMTWRLFGNGGAVAFEDRPIPEAFTRAAPAVMGWPWRAAMFKTLFRNDGGYRRMGVHRPLDPDPARLDRQRWYDGSGRILPALYHQERLFSAFGRDNYQLVQLNHYALGAMESYVLKCARGRANREASGFDLAYWVERNLTGEADISLAHKFPLAGALRARLRADPVLAPLHRAACDWRRARFLELMADEEYRALFGRLLMAGPSRVPSPDESRFLLSFAPTRPIKPLRGTKRPNYGD